MQIYTLKMHRVHSIPEVVRQVMEHLHPRRYCTNEAKKKLRSTLLNAALTCSAFSGPALDVLWYWMDDILPLFKLLPNFEHSVDKATVRFMSTIFC